MKKEIRVVDEARGILQITSTDERHYAQQIADPVTGLPRFEFRPSVTWICDFYPKGRGFESWLKKNGDESDQIARLAADRGYVIHRACAQLAAGETVKITDQFCDQEGRMRELTPDEYFASITFVQWWQAEGSERFEIMGFEFTTWPDAESLAAQYGLSAENFEFAGTVDLKLREKATGLVWIVDLKTSLDIWPSMEMQVSAYAVAERADCCAILQLNYRRNKLKKYKFTQVDGCFSLFMATRQIWKRETDGISPLQREYPLEIKL